LKLAAFKNVLNLVGTAIMILDVSEDGSLHYGYFNQAAEQFFGVRNREYTGKLIDHYRGANTERRQRRTRTIEMYQQCVTTQQSVVFDLEHVLGTGETRWGRHTIAPIFDPDKLRVVQLMVTSIDVTELVITEKRLDQALTRTLSGFVSICAECKDIKSDKNWISIEQFASTKMDYHEFSHGLCPNCVTKYHGQTANSP
jgi:PAS domain S-box-containing protein